MISAGTLQHQIDAQGCPIDAFGGGTAQDLHAVTINMQTIALDLHFAGEPAVGGVEACQVFDTGHVRQIVDRDNLEPGLFASLEQRTQDATTNPAVAVECNFVGTRLRHGVLDRRRQTNSR
ncbi:hypothetical protein D9M72_554660 [compost metagenome]